MLDLGGGAFKSRYSVKVRKSRISVTELGINATSKLPANRAAAGVPPCGGAARRCVLEPVRAGDKLMF